MSELRKIEELIDIHAKCPTGANKRRILSLIQSELEKALLDELKMLNAKHSRTYKQTVTDSSGNVYVEDSRGYISKYEVQERISELESHQPKQEGKVV